MLVPLALNHQSLLPVMSPTQIQTPIIQDLLLQTMVPQALVRAHRAQVAVMQVMNQMHQIALSHPIIDVDTIIVILEGMVPISISIEVENVTAKDWFDQYLLHHMMVQLMVKNSIASQWNWPNSEGKGIIFLHSEGFEEPCRMDIDRLLARNL